MDLSCYHTTEGRCFSVLLTIFKVDEPNRRLLKHFQMANPQLKTTRSHKVTHRIFSFDELKRFTQIIEEQVGLAKKSDHLVSCSIVVRFHDDSKIESNDGTFLLTNDIEMKRTEKFVATFSNLSLQRSIDIVLEQHRSDGLYVFGGPQSNIEVSSRDSKWVNDIFTRIVEVVDNAAPQPKWPSYAAPFVTPLACVLFLISLMMLPSSLDSRVFYGIMLFGIAVVFFMSVAPFAVNSIWPPVEFNLGPAHQMITRRRRKVILAVLTGIIIPITISIVSNLITV